jgi:hypothetical protein
LNLPRRLGLKGLMNARWRGGAGLSVVWLAVILTSTLSGCGRTRASAADCEKILDRIVEIELQERGFRDQALADRKRRELRETLSAQLKECQGKQLKPGALACVAKAKSAEEISHECLR